MTGGDEGALRLLWEGGTSCVNLNCSVSHEIPDTLSLNLERIRSCSRRPHINL